MKKLHTYIGRYWYGYLFAIFSMVTAIVLDMVYPRLRRKSWMTLLWEERLRFSPNY